LAANAAKTIDGIQDFIDATKIAALRAQVGRDRGLLRRIGGKIRLDLATAHPDKIREAIKKCKFNVTVDTSGGALKLGFEGDNPRDLIRLLTERGVESIVSGRPFIATALEVVGA
jgi:hypothetical protein